MPIARGMEKVSQPVRILAIVIVLVGVAGMLAMRMLGPSAVDETTATAAAPHAVSAGAPAPAKPVKVNPATPVKVKPAKPAKAVPTKPAKAVPTKAAKPTPAKPAKPAPAKPKPAAKPTPAVPPTGFPAAVDAALRKHAILVVSLIVPGARVDALSAAEAQAGAKLAGAGYLALNVLNEGVARALLTSSTVEDPSVLVLKRSGEIALALTGFVDRETVAQAAANAKL